MSSQDGAERPAGPLPRPARAGASRLHACVLSPCAATLKRVYWYRWSHHKAETGAECYIPPGVGSARQPCYRLGIDSRRKEIFREKKLTFATHSINDIRGVTFLGIYPERSEERPRGRASCGQAPHRPPPKRSQNSPTTHISLQAAA